MESKVRSCIDGLPFSAEGYEHAKTILKTKYGRPCEIVHAYMRNIMGLPVITGSQPRKVHEFYESLVYYVQSLETLGKLKEITGYVRTTLNKLSVYDVELSCTWSLVRDCPCHREQRK